MGNRKCFLSLRKLTQISVEERRQQTQKYIKKGFPALYYKATNTDHIAMLGREAQQAQRKEKEQRRRNKCQQRQLDKARMTRHRYAHQRQTTTTRGSEPPRTKQHLQEGKRRRRRYAHRFFLFCFSVKKPC